MRLILSFVAAILISSVSVGAVDSQQNQTIGKYVTGVVFHDANKNGIRDSNEDGLRGVRVSNGASSIKTDRNGKYHLPIGDNAVVFVIKPRNWMTRLDADNVPRFYYIYNPKGSPKLKYKGVDPTGPLPASVDFPLYPHREPNQFRTVFLGDTQVYSPEQIAYLGHDIIEELAGSDSVFSVTLGDIVGDDLSLYKLLLPVMGKIGIPSYYVKGNHDSNYDGAPDEKLIKATFERTFGPSYYSFDYGPVHFVALNNPFFAFPKIYGAKLDSEQMAFLHDDLASIPKKQLVVLMMHIPINEMTDRKEIFELLRTHPNTFSISGHTHTQEHRFLTKSDGWNGAKSHHHLVNVTSCGSWWGGMQDEVGLPHTTMRDGAPNGYSVITFNGREYSIRFKAARRPDDYQMNIYAPDTVEVGDLGDTEVLVNVFAGSERSKVEMRLDDKDTWVQMKPFKTEDPAYARTKALEDVLALRNIRQLPKGSISPHIWKANLPNGTAVGTYMINIRTTDMFHQTYEASRIINIR